MSRKASAMTVGPPSIGLPEPLKMRPSMSFETGVRMISPVNSSLVFRLSMPEVPSNTWTGGRCGDRAGVVGWGRCARPATLAAPSSAGGKYRGTEGCRRSWVPQQRTHLHDGLLAVHLEHLATAVRTIGHVDVDDLGILGTLHLAGGGDPQVRKRIRDAGPLPTARRKRIFHFPSCCSQ